MKWDCGEQVIRRKTEKGRQWVTKTSRWNGDEDESGETTGDSEAVGFQFRMYTAARYLQCKYWYIENASGVCFARYPRADNVTTIG